MSFESAGHSATLCNSRVEEAASYETHAVVEKPTPKSLKVGKISAESREKYNLFLPAVVVNVLCKSLMCLRNAQDDDADQRDAKVEVVPVANGKCILDNSHRKHSDEFK